MSAVGAGLYITLVSLFLNNAEKIFGSQGEDKFLAPMVFLTLLVFSAATMGIAIFGRPVMWYLDGLKKEALSLIFYTLGFLFVILILFLALLFIFK